MADNLIILGIVSFTFVFSVFIKPVPQVTISEPLAITTPEVKRTYRCIEHNSCRKLAEAIYYEARGEPLSGQIAVAWVILNRVNSPRFPATVEEVVNQPYQFSYLNAGKMPVSYPEFESYKLAKKIATGVLHGTILDPSNGSTFYLNPKKLKRLPKWVHQFKQVAVLGNHNFYKP